MTRIPKQTAEVFVPTDHSLNVLRQAARNCQGCDLFQFARQVVFGEGPPDAKIVLVGEQPGDEEDQQGRPFVGPAGRLLDSALAEAGLNRSEVYVTNAVKHFKFEERGKRRIHAKPSASEVSSCRPWLEAELDALHPEVTICLGATAAHSLLGRVPRIADERGRFLPHHRAGKLLITTHPSALLRMPDRKTRQTEYQRFVADLRLAAALK